MSTPKSSLGNMGITREGVERILSRPGVTDHALRCRSAALRDLADQIAHFCPWPALEQSLRADARQIEFVLELRRK